MGYKYTECESCGAKHRDKIICDVCGEVIVESDITLRQYCRCWGNDSIDGSGHATICSLRCLGNLSKADFVSCTNHTDEDEGWDYEISGFTPQQLREIARLLRDSIGDE